MKSRLFIFLSILATSITLLSAQQNGILLRRTLKENTKDVYLVTTNFKQDIEAPSSMGGSQNMTLDSSNRVTCIYGKLTEDKKKQNIEIIIDDMKFESADVDQTEVLKQFPEKFSFKAFLDEMNALSDIKVEGLNANEKMMAQGFEEFFQASHPFFPEKPVIVGETWDHKLPKHPYWGDSAKLSVKLVGEKKVEGIDCYQLETSGKIEIKIDMAEMAKGDSADEGSMPPTKTILSGPTWVDSTTYIEKNTGRIILVKSKTRSEQKIEMPDAGMTMNMKSDIVQTMKLEKSS